MTNSGIYKIINIINNKCYIGSSCEIKERLLKHKRLLITNKHHSSKLQRASDKYGLENFIFEVIEEVPNRDDLIVREQHYFDTIKPEYNIMPIAGSSRNRVLSEEHKRKIGLAHKGKIVSQESRDKMSKSFKGRKLSKETILKRSITQTGRYHKEGKHLKPVYMLDLENNILKEFCNIREASRQSGANRVSIGYVCKGKAVTAGGYKWRFKND